MKKLFGRKHKEEETADGSSLGRNNRTSQNDNPYAQSNAGSYASNSNLGSQGSQSSYQQPLSPQSSIRTTPSGSPALGRPGLPSGPRSGTTPSRQQPQNYGSEPPRYTGTPKSGSGYSDEKLGSSAGYGANRYDAGSSGYDNKSNKYGSQRPGGYGGFDQSVRDSTGSFPPPKYSATRPGGGFDAPGGQDEYMNPEDMTEEQLEDAQVRDLKRQAHDVRQDTKRTLNNAIERAREAQASGEASLAMLAEQAEKLDRVERGADAAISRARLGGEGISKLDKLNSTPFFIPVGTKKNRLADEERQIRREMEDKEAKEETRRAQYERDMKIRQAMGGSGKPKLLGAGKADKYTFEDDDGTEAADEEEINANIDVLSEAVNGLHFVANGIGAQLSADPGQIERITDKMSKADRKVTVAKAKMDGIH